MGNGNIELVDDVRTMLALLTPHGEREQAAGVTRTPGSASPNPSWGTGTLTAVVPLPALLYS